MTDLQNSVLISVADPLDAEFIYDCLLRRREEGKMAGRILPPIITKPELVAKVVKVERPKVLVLDYNVAFNRPPPKEGRAFDAVADQLVILAAFQENSPEMSIFLVTEKDPRERAIAYALWKHRLVRRYTSVAYDKEFQERIEEICRIFEQ